MEFLYRYREQQLNQHTQTLQRHAKQASGIEAHPPDLLDQHDQLMAVRLEAVRAMIKEPRSLYMALSDSQNQTADQLFWGPV